MIRPSNCNGNYGLIKPPAGESLLELGGFFSSPPARRAAMAGFGGGSGAADGLNTAPLSADTSQQTFLTAPHA
jgi:hypothetical protein